MSSGMLLALGLTAASLTITSFLAQTWKILRTQDTRSLSTPTWILSTTAFVIWVGYGVGLDDWFIIIPNALCCVLAGVILTLKLGLRRRGDQLQ